MFLRASSYSSKLYKLKFSLIFIELLNKMNKIKAIRRVELSPCYMGAVRSASKGDEEESIKYLTGAISEINRLEAEGTFDELPPGSVGPEELRDHCGRMAFTCYDILETLLWDKAQY